MISRSSWAATLIVVFTLVVVPLARADYEAGHRALDAGDVAEATRQWRAAASAEDRRSMLALGRLYTRGLGVLQDYVEAHKWFNLAASRGEVEAVHERDALTEKMTPQQVATAQERAASWQPGPVATRPRGAANNKTVPERGSTSQLATAETAGALESNEASATSPGPGVGVQPQTIREAQVLLARLGYDPGSVDGQWGARTARAYDEYLRGLGLPSGGGVDTGRAGCNACGSEPAAGDLRNRRRSAALIGFPRRTACCDDESIRSPRHGRGHRRSGERCEPPPTQRSKGRARVPGCRAGRGDPDSNSGPNFRCGPALVTNDSEGRSFPGLRALPGDGGGNGGIVPDGLAGRGGGTVGGRKTAASGNHPQPVCRRTIRGDVRSMGCVPG